MSLTTDVDETAPQGARIRRADGSAVECDLTRYLRGAGFAAWVLSGGVP